MKHLSQREWTLLAVLFVYSFVPSFGGLLRVVELASSQAIMPANPRAISDPTPIVVHVFSSFVFCIGGAVQFLPSIRREAPRVHRKLGYAVAFSGVLSAATGLWMTCVFVFPPALQGALLFWVRIGVGIAMIAFVIRAVSAAISGRVTSHRASMLRAYALGQGASTQAVLGLVWIVSVGYEPSGLARELLMSVAWVINLFVAEQVLRSMRRPVYRSIGHL